MTDTAYEIPGFVFTAKTHTYEEGTIPPEFKHIFVSYVSDASDGVVPANGSAPVVGVAQRNCKNGEVIPVMNTGISMVRLSGVVHKGDKITVNIDGHGAVAVDGDMFFHGISLAPGVLGDRIPVLLCLNSAP